MNVTIPVYIESEKLPGEKAATYTVRPLFFDGPSRRDQRLGRALSQFVGDVQKQMTVLGRAGDHEELARHTFCPSVEHHRHRITIELRGGRVNEKFAIVTFRAVDRRVCFLPAMDEVWFEVPRGRNVQDRAAEVLTEYFRKSERDGDDPRRMIDVMKARGKSWVTTVDFDVETKAKVETLKSNLLSFLSSDETPDGASELQKTGRCLDGLYPDDLVRCVHREDEVAELTRLLTGADRRPVMLLGPRMVGKTTLIHEFLFRRISDQRSQFQSKRNTWLLSPQRLISGMSYVGQWENRLLAILKHARRRKHILYFDDLVGLFRAGVSSESNLCVADVMKPFVERRDVRVLAEITPDALRVLRELDRGFADLFHIVPLAETDEDHTIRILLASVRQLERQFRCTFAIDVLPTVIDLSRRFAREAAFPGKAALVLQRLAAKHQHGAIDRDAVLADFHAQSGLQLRMMDDGQRLDRDDVIAGIEQMLVGQKPAVAAAADALCIAKARLNDPTRPLGSFLFLGPTGIGKTQTAKSISNYLFGDADRLVRFDMNEFITKSAASRLIGTFGAPDGLLTSAVRRQPFCVVLLDEIEKAHPDAFDLLLQVLGEGRLTDALGRTADFTNAIVVMTSNLGSEQALSQIGFGRDDEPRNAVFMHAAEEFFRPEFINRIDRIVPFANLKSDEVRRIARKQIEDLSRREGFVRRRCVLHPGPSILDHVMHAGFDTKWGARGVRRLVERQLVRPVASELARTVTAVPLVLDLFKSHDGIRVESQPLVDAQRAQGTAAALDTSDGEATLTAARQVLARIREQCEQFRPAGSITPGDIRPDQYHYLAIMEFHQVVQQKCEALQEQLDNRLHQRLGSDEAAAFAGVRLSGGRPVRLHIWRNSSGNIDRLVLKELAAAEDIHDYLRDVTSQAATAEKQPSLSPLSRQLSLLSAMVPSESGWSDEKAILLIRRLQRASLERVQLRRMFGNSFRFNLFSKDLRFTEFLEDDGIGKFESYESISLGLSRVRLEADEAKDRSREQPLLRPETSQQLLDFRCDAVLFEGPHAVKLLKSEEGTHLMVRTDGSLVPFQVIVLGLAPGGSADDAIGGTFDRQRQWLSDRVRGAAKSDENQFAIDRVVRIYDARGLTVDLRSGVSLEVPPDWNGVPRNIDRFITAGLPSPLEKQVT